MSQQLPDPNAPVLDGGEALDLGHRLSEVMDDLPERERYILSRRFGLVTGKQETLGDIAVDLGISAERVRQLQNAALQRLRQPRARQRLADLV